MNKGFNNFIKVFGAALVRPIRLVTLGLGILMSLFVPSASALLIPLSFAAVLVMSWIDINNPEFIKSVLSTPSHSKTSIKSVKNLIDQINQQLNLSSFAEVKFDLDKAKLNLIKIQDVLSYLDSQGESYDSFVLDSLGKMVTKMIELSKQEELARKFIKAEDRDAAIMEINDLKNQIAKVTDSVAKKEYEKVIISKENQLKLSQSVSQRLERIDSYLARIRSAMEQSYTYLTKVGLKDRQELIDESEVLTTSLESIVGDIDRFESEMLEVGEKLSIGNKSQGEKIVIKS
jgi:hypothetical protein